MTLLRMWLRQPTTVAGISALAGTVCALLTGQVTWVQAGPLITGGLVSILLPDDAGARQAAATLTQDIAVKISKS